MELTIGALALVSAFVGVFSHLAWFIHGEHHRLAAKYFISAVFGPPIVTALLSGLGMPVRLEASYSKKTRNLPNLGQDSGIPIYISILIVTVTFYSFLFGIFLSIGLYRRFFHPLGKFPGPPQARWTQLWHVSKVLKKVDHFRHLDRLHTEDGEYVRIGPNLLSVADPGWVEPIHRPQTKFGKSDWYEGDYPLTTLHQMRDKAMHDARRRHGWDKAFTTKSLRAYGSRLIKYSDQLLAQIRKRTGEAANATQWLNYLTFDIMGDLAFGRNFQALEKGESHFYIDLVHLSSRFPGILGTAPWIVQILLLIKLSWTPVGQVLLYSESCVEERRFPNDKIRERLLLMGDSRLLIIAGSDTTTTTLVHCFYHLARDPTLVEKLRAELKEQNVRNGDNVEVTSLQYLPYLNAWINETLRMHPPVPGGVYRNTPDESVVINGIRVPGGVKVIGPHYTIQRSPRAFVQPNDFIPERWTTRPDLILNKNAFFPFGMGRFSCIGKSLALNEMRTVISKMVLEFDVEFAPGEDGSKLLNESKDGFTMANAPLMLVWKEREKSSGS